MTGGPPSLVVSEVFTGTVQGEGPALGRRCSFVRLMGCNLACTWCDTPYTWDAARFDLREQGRRMPVDDIAARALADGARLVVVSGGEPLLHQGQGGWVPLLDALRAGGAEVHVETNGTIIPDRWTLERVSLLVVSPKLGHAGDPLERRIRPDVLAVFARLAGRGGAAFKFVAAGRGDIAEVAEMCRAHGIPREAVWVMPLGATSAEVLGRTRAVTEAAVSEGFNATTRLHVLAWGDVRGR